jgi:hypothetical protein
MTKEQLIEYLERTHSNLSADLDNIVTQSTEAVFALDRKDRPYVFNTLNEITEIGQELLDSVDNLIKKVSTTCK